MARPRGHLTEWKPYAATRQRLEQIETVLVEYRAHWPLTIRQVFYRLVGAHGYDKTERAYDNLAELFNKARRVPGLWIGRLSATTESRA